MRIEVDLDRDETDALLLALGTATGSFATWGDINLARRMVRLTNKLMMQNPDFMPITESAEAMLGLVPPSQKVQ